MDKFTNRMEQPAHGALPADIGLRVRPVQAAGREGLHSMFEFGDQTTVIAMEHPGALRTAEPGTLETSTYQATR